MSTVDNGNHNRYCRARTLLDDKGMPAMYLCLCKGITDSDVREAVRGGIVLPRQLKAKFGLKEAGCCGRCSKNIHEFVQTATNAHQAPSSTSVRR